MDEQVVTIFVGFGGVILGAMLTWFSEWYGGKKEKKELIEGIRMLLSLEIATNLQEIKDFWGEVNEVGEKEKEGHSWEEYAYARRVIKIPFPAIKRDAFQTQMPRLPEALDKGLLVLVLKHYNLLTQLKVYRDALRTASDEDKAHWELVSQGKRSVPIRDFRGLPRNFEMTGPANYSEFKSIVEQLISDSNPIKV